MSRLRRSVGCLTIALSASPGIAAAQFEALSARANLDATPETTCRSTNEDLDPDLQEVLRSLEALDGVIVVLPERFGRVGAKCLYRVASFSALAKLEGDVRDDQQLLTTDVVSGMVGSIPVAVSGAFVLSKSERDSVMTGSGMEFVDGIASRLTALARNGGSLAFRSRIPIVVSWGPNVRWSQSAALEAGVLGDLADPDDLDGSYSAGLEGTLALTIRKNDREDVVGSILVPYRLAYVGVFGDLRGDEEDLTTEDLLRGNGFPLFQTGVGLTDAEGEIRGGLTVAWPLDDAVREIVPRFTVNLRLALPANDDTGT